MQCTTYQKLDNWNGGGCHLDVVMTGFAVIDEQICTSTEHLQYQNMDILLRCLIWENFIIFRFSFSSNKVHSFPLHIRIVRVVQEQSREFLERWTE